MFASTASGLFPAAHLDKKAEKNGSRSSQNAFFLTIHGRPFSSAVSCDLCGNIGSLLRSCWSFRPCDYRSGKNKNGPLRLPIWQKGEVLCPAMTPVIGER